MHNGDAWAPGLQSFDGVCRRRDVSMAEKEREHKRQWVERTHQRLERLDYRNPDDARLWDLTHARLVKELSRPLDRWEADALDEACWEAMHPELVESNNPAYVLYENEFDSPEELADAIAELHRESMEEENMAIAMARFDRDGPAPEDSEGSGDPFGLFGDDEEEAIHVGGTTYANPDDPAEVAKAKELLKEHPDRREDGTIDFMDYDIRWWFKEIGWVLPDRRFGPGEEPTNPALAECLPLASMGDYMTPETYRLASNAIFQGYETWAKDSRHPYVAAPETPEDFDLWDQWDSYISPEDEPYYALEYYPPAYPPCSLPDKEAWDMQLLRDCAAKKDRTPGLVREQLFQQWRAERNLSDEDVRALRAAQEAEEHLALHCDQEQSPFDQADYGMDPERFDAQPEDYDDPSADTTGYVASVLRERALEAQRKAQGIDDAADEPKPYEPSGRTKATWEARYGEENAFDVPIVDLSPKMQHPPSWVSERRLMAMTERQREFLYFIASKTTKGQHDKSTSFGQIYRFGAQFSAEGREISMNWLDWLATEEGQELFAVQELVEEPEDDALLQTGRYAPQQLQDKRREPGQYVLMYWARGPKMGKTRGANAPDNSRVLAGHIVMLPEVAKWVRRALDLHFDQCPMHLRPLWEAVKAGEKVNRFPKMPPSLRRWFFYGCHNELSPEPSDHPGYEHWSDAYAALPPLLRPSFDAVKQGTFLPSLAEWDYELIIGEKPPGVGPYEQLDPAAMKAASWQEGMDEMRGTTQAEDTELWWAWRRQDVNDRGVLKTRQELRQEVSASRRAWQWGWRPTWELPARRGEKVCYKTDSGFVQAASDPEFSVNAENARPKRHRGRKARRKKPKN